MKLRILSLLLLVTISLPLSGICGGNLARKDELKSKLRFNDWVNGSKDGLQYLFLTMNISEILDSDNRIEYTTNVLPEKTIYDVRCFLENNKERGSGFEDLAFTVTVFPAVVKARESIIDVLSLYSAPVEYLDEKWKSENVTLGDKAFGKELWCFGNAVIRLGNRSYDPELASSVFARFENFFRRKMASKEMDILPLQGSIGDGTVRLDAQPESSTVFITAPAEYDITIGASSLLTINKRYGQDVEMNKIHVNTVHGGVK